MLEGGSTPVIGRESIHTKRVCLNCEQWDTLRRNKELLAYWEYNIDIQANQYALIHVDFLASLHL